MQEVLQFISGSIVISNPPELILDVVEDMNNITLSASGGVPPYLFSLDGIDFSDQNVFEDLDDGEYPCTVMDANGCETTILVTIGISNTRNLDFDLEMLVQPNPSNGNFIISIKQKETADLKFKVFDVTGKLVFYEKINSVGNEFKKDLDLTHLAGGTYHLVVSSDLQIGVKKLVVLK